MFDNVAFNVVIGLTLIYLLYSLLTTLVGEMVASWMGVRQRLLRFSIERMLNDGASANTNIWQRLWIQPADNFDNSLAGKFYAYPSIKYLSKGQPGELWPGAQTKPAYLTADYFAETLINLLSDYGAGCDKFEQIRFCLRYNTLHIEPETLLHIRNLFNNSYGRLELFHKNLVQWFHETQDRNNGWYKHRIRIILFSFGFLLAVVFNIDSIRIAHFLSIDQQARNQLVNMGIAVAHDTAFAQLSTHNPNPLENIPLSSSSLDTGLSRVSTDLQAAQQILGLGWKFSSDLPDLEDKFDSSKKKAIYTTITRKIGEFHTIHKIDYLQTAVDDLFTPVQNDLYTIESDQTHILALKHDIIRAKEDTVGYKPKPQVKPDTTIAVAIRHVETLLKDIARAELALQADSIKYRSDRFLYYSARRDYAQTSHLIDSLTNNDFARIEGVRVNPKTLTVFGKRPYHVYGVLKYVLYHTFCTSALIGFLLTALALSLGAPFWFDLLNKLVSIRGSGIKPEEKKAPTVKAGTQIGPAGTADAGAQNVPTPTAPTLLATTPAPGSDPEDATIEAALSVYGQAIRGESGVLSTHRGYFFSGNRPNECLQVTVLDEPTRTTVREKYGALELFKHVTLQVDVTGRPRLTASAPTATGDPKRALGNATGIFGWGSFGCLVTDNDDATKKYAVSCYHVLNGDLSWNNTGADRTVVNQSGIIATDYEGWLNDKVDAAYAGPLSTANYKFYSKFKPQGKKAVTKANLGQAVSFSGFASSGAGTIVNDSCPATFNYPLGPNSELQNPMTDLIAVSGLDANKDRIPISKDGDSGSMVIDEDGMAIGLIIGIDLQQTYIMKITNIETQLSVKLDI